MTDSTIVAVVAIVTTGIVTGIAGPAITALATSRGQKRKFHQERFLRDSDEIRRHLDSTLGALDSLVRCLTGLGSLVTSLGIGAASSQLLDELEREAESFNQRLARLTIRVGPDTELIRICDQLIEAVHEVQAELVLISGLGHVLDDDQLDDEERVRKTSEHRQMIWNLMDRTRELGNIRSIYVNAGSDLAAVIATSEMAA